MSADLARRAAEEAARHSYGRLLAYLASRTRDVAAAEDALADAFHAAVRTWPARGVPASPDAWLLTAARRSLVSGHRRQRVRTQAEPIVAHLQALAAAPADDTFPDERLKLLFICAHPAIEASVRAPLMLQVVLGLDAARLASAFLVAPATMSQRLVRAKTKIAAAGIPFIVPEPEQLPERLGDVLDAIYAAFGIAWSEVVHGTERWMDLADEAIWLATLLVSLMPDAAEARGLLALLRHSHARRAARRDAGGRFVPLSEQDVAAWDHEAMDEADRQLEAAAALRHPGPYQIEATIQAAHGFRRHGGAVGRHRRPPRRARRSGAVDRRPGESGRRRGSGSRGCRGHGRAGGPGRGAHRKLSAVLGLARAPAGGTRRHRVGPRGLRTGSRPDDGPERAPVPAHARPEPRVGHARGSRLPTPDSRFPVPRSPFPIPSIIPASLSLPHGARSCPSLA